MAHRKKIARGLREAVYVRDRWMCQYCGLQFDPARRWNNKPGAAAYIYLDERPGDWIQLEIDHIHPVHLGGENSLDNLRAACQPCNGSKHIKTGVA